MSIRGLAGLLALLGGAAWVAAATFGVASPWWDELRWGGLGAVLFAFVCLGLNLLTGSSRWLDVVVGAAFPLLAWALYALLGDVLGDADGATRALHGALGAGFLVTSVLLLRGGRRERAERSGEPAAPRPKSHRA